MDPLKPLLTRLDSFLEAQNRLVYRYDAGLAVELPRAALRAGAPDFGRIESLLAVTEASEARRTEDADRIFFRALRPFLAEEVLHARADHAEEEIHALEAQQEVTFGGEILPFREARYSLPLEPSHEKRVLNANAMSAFLLAHRGPYARRAEAAIEGFRALGFETGAAYREAFLGEKDAERIIDDAQSLLRSTEDAYRDVLGYVLKRVDPALRGLPNGTAGLVDVAAAGVATALLNALPPREGPETLTRWLLEWGFHPGGEGNLRLDSEERPGKSAAPFVHAVRVPQEIRMGVRPGNGGIPEYVDVARAYGEALRLGALPSEAGLTERRLYDARVPAAYGALFALALGQAGWHRRYRGASKPQAREAARLLAFFELFNLRRVAAEALYHLNLESRGPGPVLADDYAGRLESVLYVRAPKGHFLERARLGLSLGDALRSRALGAGLATMLERRFDEDFFRNPAASSWLKASFRSLEREDAARLDQQLGPAPATLTHAGARTVRVLGA